MNVKVFSPRASILSSNFALSLLIAGHLAGCGGSGSSGSSPVVKTTPTITWATPASVPAGTVLGSAQLDATASEPGSFVYTPAAGAVLSTVGTNTLSVSFTPTDTTDYNSASASVSITVTAVKATPTITWSTPASVPVGTVLGATQLDATASVAGAFVYSPAAGTALLPPARSRCPLRLRPPTPPTTPPLPIPSVLR